MSKQTCPTCKGTGKVNVKFSEWGSNEPPKVIKLNCVDCDGTGQVTHEDLDAIEFEKNMWCRCGNPSNRSNYHPDNTGIIDKHHYTCCDCGKITQVG